MSEIVEYEISGTKDDVSKFLEHLNADSYIKYVIIDNVKIGNTNIDEYTSISIAFDTTMIFHDLKGFTCKKEIMEAIIDLIGEKWNLYGCYTVADVIDTLTNGYFNSYLLFEWIINYMKGVLTDKDYNDFLDRVAMYRKYGGTPPLKLERGLRNKGYLKY